MVIADFGDFKVTVREAIFSITIASVLFFFGFCISGFVEHAVNQSNMEYRQAVQIDGMTNEFALAMRTDVGNAFVNGDFHAIDKVSHSKLNGEWLWISADYQEYRHHTRIVHYTTGTGKNIRHHQRIEHYWSWDTYDSESMHSKEVLYCGSRFPYGKFNYWHVNTYGKTVDNGYHKRICFEYMPTDFAATIYSFLKNDSVTDGTVLFKDISIETLYLSKIESCAVTLFWIFWSILIIVSVILFVYLENNWIEDSDKRNF